MKTSKLNKTNIITDINLIYEIERNIGTEITDVVTYNPNRVASFYEISPYTNLFNTFRPDAWSKDVKFDKLTQILTTNTRKKWARKWVTSRYRLMIVGYKLPTTNISEGYIYGNPVKINKVS